MFFIRISNALAYIGFWLGLLYLGFCIFLAIAMPEMAFNSDGSHRYLATANTGEAINEAMLFILCAVVIGVLSEIGAGIANQSSKVKNEDQ